MYSARPLARLSSKLARPASKPLQQTARFSQSTRRFVELPQRPAPGKKDIGQGVLYPKTRICIGIVFCGALIYSMVSKQQCSFSEYVLTTAR